MSYSAAAAFSEFLCVLKKIQERDGTKGGGAREAKIELCLITGAIDSGLS